jgi:4-azaleucine resistance transporter AzlC
MTEPAPAAPTASEDRTVLEASRRRLVIDGFGIGVSAAAFGFVFGLSAQRAGFLPIEAVAFSTIVFAGAAQFAAVGYVAGGVAWPVIFVLTALLNARHLLYSAALAPWLRDVPVPRRAVIAHLLTDESFALTIAHFSRAGRSDERGYWLAAIGWTFIPWNAATIVGVLAGQEIPGPERFGLDVVFPAAMIGLAAGLIAHRRDVVAAATGAAVAVAISLAVSPSVGIVAGGLLGPFAGLAMPVRAGRAESDTPP